MRDDFAGLSELIAVAEKRSFTAAAAELRVTPPAVSQTVRALEERVGVRLLQRTTRSVGLTEAGARFLARLKPAVAGVREAFESIAELRDRPAGVLRLSVPRLGYQQVIAPRLAAFLAAHPDITLDVSVDDGFVDIVEQGFDAGMRIGEMVAREMIAVRVTPNLQTAVVGAPAYFAARGKPKRPRDLASHDCINYRRRSSGAIYRWEFTRGESELEIAVDGRLLVNDADFMLDAAVAGLGLAYLMDVSVREHLADGRLERVLERYCAPYPGFFLYYPSRAQLAPKLAALVEFLRAPVARRRAER